MFESFHSELPKGWRFSRRVRELAVRGVVRDKLSVEDLTLDFSLAGRIDDGVVKKFLGGLCGGGLALRGASTDSSPLYRGGKLLDIWPGVVHQQCVFHLVYESNKDLLHAAAAVRKKVPKLQARRCGRPCRRGRPRTDRVGRRKLISQHRFLFTRRPDHLSDEDKQHLAVLSSIAPELGVIRRFTGECHYLISPEHTPSSARQIRDRMVGDPDYAKQPDLVRIAPRGPCSHTGYRSAACRVLGRPRAIGTEANLATHFLASCTEKLKRD